MARPISTRAFTVMAIFGVVAALAVLLLPASGLAFPSYASATGQPCSACHVSAAGGGALTAAGSAFAAIPSHATDPAGAWAQASGGGAQPPAAAPAPAPSAPAPSAPAAVGQVTATMSGAATDGSVVYSVMLLNTGNTDLGSVFVAGSIPAGATLTGSPSTPEGATFFGSDQGGVSWVVPTVAAKSSIGPFVYTVSKGAATDLTASAFAHWLKPTEGSTSSPAVMPVDNDERLAVDQAINNKLNNLDRSLTLWNIQPGLGTVMIEYSIRFANLWFAGQAKNWSMARYQVAEMTEIQEVGETTRPARAPALKNFENTFLVPLDAAAQAKDLNAFMAAYDQAIGGCNSCHSASTGLPPDRSIAAKFIKIQRPTAPVFPNVDWAGQ